MIVDIPTAADFQSAGLKQVHLAWQIAMQSVYDFDEATYYKLADETPEEAAEEFWQRSQPALANAYSLIQQGYGDRAQRQDRRDHTLSVDR